MHSFSEQMRVDCGVIIIDMSIEDVKITNPELVRPPPPHASTPVRARVHAHRLPPLHSSPSLQAKAMAQGAVARTNLIKAQIDQDVMRSQASAEQSAEVRAATRATAKGRRPA